MSCPSFLTGCLAPVYSVFHEDQRFDPDGQCRLFDYLLEFNCISAFFVRSGMGQMYTFDLADTKAMIKTACSHLESKVPILAGCMGIWDRDFDRLPDPQQYLEQSLELSRFAQDAGASAVVHTVPEGLQAGPGETPEDVILRFVERLSAELTIPILLYQAPGTREDYLVSPELLCKLAALDGVAGMKASQSDVPYIYTLIRAVRDLDFTFICGCEFIYYAALAAGARAVIGQGCTANPSVLNAVARAWEAGDHEAMRTAQDVVNNLVWHCANPQDFLKRYAAEQGYAMGSTARTCPNGPYQKSPKPLSEAEYTAYKAEYEAVLRQFPGG